MIERLGDEVGRELRRLGPEAGVGELARAWPAAVGDVISRNAWPARVGRDGTLYVTTSSSTWAFELTQLGPTLLERLREQLGESAPRAVRFAPGPLPAPAPPAAEAGCGPSLEPSPDEREIAAQLARGIADERLRTAVARAAAAGLAARRASSPERTPDRSV